MCIISSSYVNSNWSCRPDTAKLGFDLCDLDLWPLTLTICMDLTLVIVNNSWNFMIRWWEHSKKGVTHGQTDRQTDRQTESTICRAAWSQLKNCSSYGPCSTFVVSGRRQGTNQNAQKNMHMDSFWILRIPLGLHTQVSGQQYDCEIIPSDIGKCITKLRWQLQI